MRTLAEIAATHDTDKASSAERVTDRLELFGLRGRKADDPHAEVRARFARDEQVTAVDRDFVASLDEASAELLRKRLETAIVGGNPSGAKDGDTHWWMVPAR